MSGNESRAVRAALFSEAMCQDLDRLTKELLDAAERLSWSGCEVGTGSIDRWIGATGSALTRLRAARSQRAGTVEP